MGDGHVVALGELGDFLPYGRGGSHAPTLDGVDDEILLYRLLADRGILDVILVIHVGRRVPHEEYELENFLALVPLDLGYGLVQGLIDGLRGVAAALGLKLHQLGVYVVDIFGKVMHLRDVGVLAIAVSDEPDAKVGYRLGGENLVGDGPYLLLGALDEASHGTGGVEDEADLDGLAFLLGVFLGLLLAVLGGKAGKREAGSNKKG